MAFMTISAGYTVRALLVAPVTVFIAAELWERYGRGSWKTGDERMLRAEGLTAGPLRVGRWTLAAPTTSLPGIRPGADLTATAGSLRAPPIADPNELLEYVAAALGRRGAYRPEPLTGTVG